MRVEICFQSYAQNFTLIFANYDEYCTNINFKNSYDIYFGSFNCAFRASLSDFKDIEGMNDFEILGLSILMITAMFRLGILLRI